MLTLLCVYPDSSTFPCRTLHRSFKELLVSFTAEWLPSAKVKETETRMADTQECRRDEAHELWYNKPVGSLLSHSPLRPLVLHLCHYLLFLCLPLPMLFFQISSPSHLTVPSCVPLFVPSYTAWACCLFLSWAGNQAAEQPTSDFCQRTPSRAALGTQDLEMCCKATLRTVSHWALSQ